MNLLSDGLQALKQHLSSVPLLEINEVSAKDFEDASPDIALRVRYAGGDQLSNLLFPRLPLPITSLF